MKYVTRLCGAFALIGALGVTSLEAASTGFTAPATPRGVTIQPATPAGYDGTGASGPYFGDAVGMTLYTFDKDPIGLSVCNDDCAAAWPPLIAVPGSAPAGSWSLITRDGGQKQWALHGKPVYTFVQDKKVGDGNGVDVADLWRKAEFKPKFDIKFPEGTNLREVFGAGGQVLVDANDLTLYTSSDDPVNGPPVCVGVCTDTWAPHLAPEIANTVGEFTVKRRDDGVNQWAFKGKPLYTFVGDHGPGKAQGVYKYANWQPAMLVKYFMPNNVVINDSARHGAILTTTTGYPLYAKDANKFTGGGASHADLSIARGDVATGRQIGLSGCDEDCEETWIPFLAADNDEPTGYWDIVNRRDGKRQWVYLGYALYTYTLDEPGTILGHDIYDLKGKVPDAKGSPMNSGMQALYWRVALP